MNTIYKTLAFLVLLCAGQQAMAQNFITQWNLATAGSGATQLSFGTATSGSVNYTWQELSPGSASGSGSWSGSTLTITGLPTGATIRLQIEPANFQRIIINEGTDRNRLTQVEQWGSIAWTGMQNAFGGSFGGCTNLQVTATDIPNLSVVINMAGMFQRCTNLNSPFNINTWNTASVTNMSNMFSGASSFNQDVGGWNVSNVTNMSNMFIGASSFNQNIGGWDVGNVTNMSYMFFGASAFNQDIGGWNLSNISNMTNMFAGASSFNQNISGWDVGNVTNMSSMFFNSTSFNQDIGGWDVGNVIDLSSMFRNAASFNQDIGTWNVSSVINMSGTFSGASSFNQDISGWDVSNVTNMSSTFWNAFSFNQDIGMWNVSNVTNMLGMFYGAHSFNKDISAWDVRNVTNMDGMFTNAFVFNQDIGLWNVSNVTNMSNMFLAAYAFNQNINGWNVGSVTSTGYMFYLATSFNESIASWNVSSVTDMTAMFQGANLFNQDIGTWDVSNVTSMNSIFNGANSFNQDIAAWNVSGVNDMSNMFTGAVAFNQNISGWDVSNATSMSQMFQNANSFNQNIGAWILNPVVNLANMLNNSGIDCNNYSATLIGWSANPSTPNGRSLGATGRQYGTNAVAARTDLTTTKGWIITGDIPSGAVCGSVPPPTITSFNPPAGSIGTEVIITGTNFDPVAANNDVKFNGVSTITPSVASLTSLTVTIPNGATSGPISVTTSAGTAVSSTNFTITCTPPLAPSAPSASRCGSGTITLTATGATGTQEYRWYDVAIGGTSLSSIASFPTPSLTITTSYYVSIFDVGTSCESTRTPVDAIVNTPPALPTGNGNSGCSGTSISVSATGGSAGQYRWYTVATGGTHDVAQTNDTYVSPTPLTANTSFWVSINNGTCESDRAEVIATVISLPTEPGVPPVNPVCPGSNVTLTASGGIDGQYRWYDGATLLIGEVNSTYTVIGLTVTKTFQAAIHDGTCESNKMSVTATVQNCTPPTVASTTATAFIEGLVVIDLQELISDPEDNIDPARITITSQPTSGAFADLSGFQLRINYAGFPFVGSDEVGIEACDFTNLCTVQNITIELGGEITVYNALSPNADGKNDSFVIRYIDVLPETKSNTVRIINRWGDVVWSGTNYNNNTVKFEGLNPNGKELPTGTYYYVIEFKDGKTKTGFISLKR